MLWIKDNFAEEQAQVTLLEVVYRTWQNNQQKTIVTLDQLLLQKIVSPSTMIK
jgi:hypothetical protein